jgi:predicted nucleotidyltransferase
MDDLKNSITNRLHESFDSDENVVSLVIHGSFITDKWDAGRSDVDLIAVIKDKNYYNIFVTKILEIEREFKIPINPFFCISEVKNKEQGLFFNIAEKYFIIFVHLERNNI